MGKKRRKRERDRCFGFNNEQVHYLKIKRTLNIVNLKKKSL